MAMNAPPIKIKPTRLPIKMDTWGVAKEPSTMKSTNVIAMPTPNRAIAAKNLPQIIPDKLTGAVSRAWSVFILVSSLISRMVSTGMQIISTSIMLEKI